MEIQTGLNQNRGCDWPSPTTTNCTVEETYDVFDPLIKELEKGYDASKQDGSLGRLVNDDHKALNCVMKKVEGNQKPHLVLFCMSNIAVGEELRYN